jgi:uncharacterized protein with von Willebrand factor type A (vWA) domain
MGPLECIVQDGYDREVFRRILKRSPELARVEERMQRILPHAEALLGDLFAALYKLNVELRPAADVSGAVLIHRRLLESVLKSRPLADLRRRTALSEAECKAALPGVAERLLAGLLREYRFEADELLDLSELAEDEANLALTEQQKKQLEQLADQVDPVKKEALRRSLDDDAAAMKKRIAAARKRQAELASKLTTELEDQVELKLGQLPEQIDGAAEAMASMGLGAGADAKVAADKRLELGERLMRSKKLRLLAKLVGAFREVALEARRRRIARQSEELHAVNVGRALERLLPSELLGVRTGTGTRFGRGLHLDFLRRLVEGQLLEYQLDASAERGPMVVCVDGSGSMSGSKELWAKAVALTLMDIARRERRRCLALSFSSGSPPAEFEFLGKTGARARAAVRDEEVLRFAEHFPGGGTSFEEPLRRAVEAVAAGRYRRGDIVFISDGEADVSAKLLDELAAKKKKYKFEIHGILVDVGASAGATLVRFADDMRKISDLTADSLSDLFASV